MLRRAYIGKRCFFSDTLRYFDNGKYKFVHTTRLYLRLSCASYRVVDPTVECLSILFEQYICIGKKFVKKSWFRV